MTVVFKDASKKQYWGVRGGSFHMLTMTYFGLSSLLFFFFSIVGSRRRILQSG